MHVARNFSHTGHFLFKMGHVWLSDVNKDLGPKANAKTKDLIPNAKAKDLVPETYQHEA